MKEIEEDGYAVAYSDMSKSFKLICLSNRKEKLVKVEIRHITLLKVLLCLKSIMIKSFYY